MRPFTERPLPELKAVTLRLQRHADLSALLSPAQKILVKKSLGVVLGTFQDAEDTAGEAPAKRKPARKRKA
jgi:hypothetical protein